MPKSTPPPEEPKKKKEKRRRDGKAKDDSTPLPPALRPKAPNPNDRRLRRNRPVPVSTDMCGLCKSGQHRGHAFYPKIGAKVWCQCGHPDHGLPPPKPERRAS